MCDWRVLSRRLYRMSKEINVREKISHSELINIYDDFLNEDIKECIKEFLAQDLENENVDYSSEMIWNMDAKIEGIGAYCMPANPVRNPFPAGIKRALYRPLQYARSSIDLCDIRIFAREVIKNAGMHLEAACRLYIQETNILGQMRFSNSTLGKAVHVIEKEGVIEPKIIDALYDFVKIYNRSKHEINQDMTKDRMFNVADALVAYFAVRMIGVFLLQKINVEESFGYYKSNNETNNSIVK